MNPPPIPPRRALIEAVVASTIGTTIEWYDFFLYGTVAGFVFPSVFFPRADPFTGQILAFSTFAVGFLARPLGGVIFGYMGDRLGRKSALVSTLLLMGVSTLLIGFLPGYDDWGVAAPVLLTVLRFFQGLGVGGEWGGAVLMALEYSGDKRRGFVASWPQAGVPLGLLASTAVVAWCESALGEAAFLAWGWRIPFYLSALLIVVGLLIRLRILETPLFAALKEKKQLAETPVRDTIRKHWREILLAAGARTVENASFYLFTASAIAYGREVLRVPIQVMLQAVNVAAIVAFFTIPFFGWLSDRLSRRATYMAGCMLMFAVAMPFYALLQTTDPAWIMFAVVLGLGICHALLYSVQAALIPELFGTKLRCTGASIGYQLGAPLAGGLAPVIAALLIRAHPLEYWPLAAYIMVMALISLVCVYALAETSKKDLSKDDG